MVCDNTAHLGGSKPSVNVPSQHDLCSRTPKNLYACLHLHSSTTGNEGKTRHLPSSLLKHFLGYYAKAGKTVFLIIELLRTVLKCKPFPPEYSSKPRT